MEEVSVMTDTTVVSWTPPEWSLHGSAQIKAAWESLDALYREHRMDARTAGARAAAEWSMGVSAVSPITNQRVEPSHMQCRWESHTANMRNLGIGVEPANALEETARRSYARGAAGWLFWWTGLEPLPGWLRRGTPVDPAAS